MEEIMNFNGQIKYKLFIFFIVAFFLASLFSGCSYSVGEDILPVPYLLFGSINTDGDAFLWWSDLDEAGFSNIDNYYIYSASSSGGSYDWEDSSSKSYWISTAADESSSRATNDSSNSTTLYYKVAVYENNSAGDKSEAIKISPTAVTLVSDYESSDIEFSNPDPSDGNLTVDTDDLTKLNWDNEDDGLTYAVFLGKDGLSSLPVAVGLSGSALDLEGNNITLDPDSTYKWKVVASDGAEIAGSPVWTFTTQSNTTTSGTGQLFSSGNLSSTIWNDDTNTYSMTISGGPSSISSVMVTIDLTHPYTDDLDIVLQSPNNTRVTLSSDNGGSGDDYTSTTLFDDSGLTDIYSASAPFTGFYKPEGSFTSFDDEDADGTWRLEITDDSSFNNSLDGTLNHWALTFNALEQTTITDRGTVESSMVVSGATSSVNTVAVTVDIEHYYDADLDIYLVSPNDTEIMLSTDNGGSGNHFSFTRFVDSASTGITSGSAPFNGNYYPEENLSNLDGENPNGTWKLKVTDDDSLYSTDSGTLNSWHLEIR